jgi:hypothetical protein
MMPATFLPMATKKTAATKVAPAVSPEPPDDVTVIIPDEMEATGGTTGGTGGTTGGTAPAAAPAPAPAAAPAPAPAAGGGTTPGGALNAGDPTGYAAWVVPAPAALATAAVGTPGYFMGIRQGVENRTAPFAAWLGTDAPSASWPN